MWSISRREFLKSTAVGLGGIAITPWNRVLLGTQVSNLPEFPSAERLGRVLDGKVALKAKPDIDSADIGEVYEDDLMVWLREIVGARPLWHNQNFIETPDGYIYAPNLQLVFNRPNEPLSTLPGEGGMWVEVTVPYVDLVLVNPPGRSPWLKHTSKPRLYYSQIMWVDEIKVDDLGQIWYRVLERYGSYGDIFWVPAEALRPISAKEMSPINPDVEDKRVEVNVNYQTLSCFEGQTEVFFCRVSTGAKSESRGETSNKWGTPLGKHTIWRKLVSVHMTGGTTGGGYDLPGIGWTILFSGKGMAIHSTFWHNSYGIPRSHGCVNAKPEDAKWIFRWTLPEVPTDTGEISISGKGSTNVYVTE
jgi:hypothetical protein